MKLKKNPLIMGTLILSASGFLSRGIGFFYRSFLSRRFGEESMGLLQLISPVLMIAFSLTAAGMQTAISRFTATSLARHKEEEARGYLWAGCGLCVLLASLYALLVYHGAEGISRILLGDGRLASLLRITAFSFPLSSLHCCLNGYYYGKKETRLPAFMQLTEQMVRVGSAVFLYAALSKEGQPTIAIAAWAALFGEAVSTALSYLTYRYRTNGAASSQNPLSPLFGRLKELLGTALPLSLSRLILNLLHAVEAAFLPRGLMAFGYSSSAALSIYGVLTGMALTLILFPAAFTNSYSVLLLPAVAESIADGDLKRTKKIISRSLAVSLTLGLACGLGFFFTGDYAGKLLFDSILAGAFIRTLSLFCPFLYLQTTLSGILHGLGKTSHSLFINLVSQLIHLSLLFSFLPRIGIGGYFLGLLCSDLCSAFLSFLVIRREICYSKRH